LHALLALGGPEVDHPGAVGGHTGEYVTMTHLDAELEQVLATRIRSGLPILKSIFDLGFRVAITTQRGVKAGDRGLSVAKGTTSSVVDGFPRGSNAPLSCQTYALRALLAVDAARGVANRVVISLHISR
jgi:hypothetical protein